MVPIGPLHGPIEPIPPEFTEHGLREVELSATADPPRSATNANRAMKGQIRCAADLTVVPSNQRIILAFVNDHGA
jgi:hypothetical protein